MSLFPSAAQVTIVLAVREAMNHRFCGIDCITLAGVFLAVIVGLGLWRPLYANEDARTVVAAYCRADCEGATLGTENYMRSVIPQLLWKEEHKPAWDFAILIDGFKIASVQYARDQSRVTVEFSVIGEWAGGADLKTESRVARYVFSLKKVHGSWKLVDPVRLPPHVSLVTAIRHTEMLLETQREVQPEAPKMIEKLKALGTTANTAMQPTACSGG